MTKMSSQPKGLFWNYSFSLLPKISSQDLRYLFIMNVIKRYYQEMLLSDMII